MIPRFRFTVIAKNAKHTSIRVATRLDESGATWATNGILVFENEEWKTFKKLIADTQEFELGDERVK